MSEVDQLHSRMHDLLIDLAKTYQTILQYIWQSELAFAVLA